MENYNPIRELDVKITEEMIKELREEYPRLWATYHYAFLWMPDKDLARMVYIAVNVCPHCHDDPKGCSCWNDI